LYQIIRPFAKLTFLVNYRKIYLSNAEVIPWDKPTVFATNHPSAFLEPCLLACFLPKPLYFLVRGDIWENKFYNALMRGVHLIPVYRLRDGYSNLSKNYETFEICYHSLAKHQPILVFPEASTKQVKRLRPVKKGVAKICFGAMEATPGLDLYIVPAGINFTYADQVRSEVMIRFGEPIRMQDYWEQYQANPARTYVQIAQELDKRLRPHMVIIEREEDEDLAEKLLSLGRERSSGGRFPIFSTKDDRLKMEIAIVNWVNGLPEGEKVELQRQVDAYFKKLNVYKLSPQIRAAGQPTLLKKLILFSGFVPYLIGKIFFYPPIKLAFSVANKRVRQLEFYISVFAGVVIVITPIWFMLMLLLALLSGNWWVVLFVAIMPLLGYFSLVYKEENDRVEELRNFNDLPGFEKKEILRLRQSLLDRMHFLLEKNLT
jgi:1-acyl-sn-glycerol-3-phosphate acyltransferase